MTPALARTDVLNQPKKLGDKRLRIIIIVKTAFFISVSLLPLSETVVTVILTFYLNHLIVSVSLYNRLFISLNSCVPRLQVGQGRSRINPTP